MNKKAVYFFCMDAEKDPVASSVFEYLKNKYPLQKTGIFIDGHEALMQGVNDDLFYFAGLNEVLSHDYPKYLEPINKHFSNFDFAGVVNWHEGKNAPDKILSLHTTGDVSSGNFGKANPKYTKALLTALEQNRIKSGYLEDFRAVMEATHWSGIPYKSAPELIKEFKVPLVDVEIGSQQESWQNKYAIAALGDSLTEVFIGNITGMSILCVGGVHIEPSFTEAALSGGYIVSHILPNHWMVNLGAGEEGRHALEHCIETINEGIEAIAFHDNLKGPYKALCRETAAAYGIEAFKHQVLRKK